MQTIAAYEFIRTIELHRALEKKKLYSSTLVIPTMPGASTPEFYSRKEGREKP